MHFKSLLHVRDHAKVVGTAHHLLEYIAQHTNMHTGEAFELTVERQAHRLNVTPQWVGQLRRHLVESGELIVQQSRGRRPNVYIIPYERCPACQGDDINPKVEVGDDLNPELQPQTQPQTRPPPTPNSAAPQPVGKVLRFPSVQPQTAPQKEVKEVKEKKDGPTPNVDHDQEDRRPDPRDEFPSGHILHDKAETDSPFWCAACGYSTPTCAHRVLEVARSTPTGAVLRSAPARQEMRR
jgi:hypothetical protein